MGYLEEKEMNTKLNKVLEEMKKETPEYSGILDEVERRVKGKIFIKGDCRVCSHDHGWGCDCGCPAIPVSIE